MKIYIYPARKGDTQQLSVLGNFEAGLPAKLKNLFRFLMDNDKLEDIAGANTELLHITSDEVLANIKRCESGWESSVPRQVEEAIKQHGLFGFPRQAPAGPPADGGAEVAAV